jgi:hypothetical protein
MPIIVVGAEKTFAELGPRLFRGKVSDQDRREVAEAVVEANPHVNLEELTPGTVLTVPDLPPIQVRGPLSLDETTTASIEALAEAAVQTVETLVIEAAGQERALRDERTQALDAMKAIEAMTERPKDRRLAKDLASARAAIEEEDVRAKERTATLQKAQKEWVAGLQELKERISGAPRSAPRTR